MTVSTKVSAVKNVINTSLANTILPIQTVKTTDLFLNPMLSISNDKSHAVIRDNKVMGFVSPNFQVLEPSVVHATMVEAMEKLAKKGTFESTGKIDFRGNYQLRYTIDAGKSLSNVGDKSNPFFEVSCGIAGTKSAVISSGAMRMVCSNGLVIPEMSLMQKAKNTINVHSKKLGIDLEKMIPFFEKFIENFQLDFVNVQERLTAIEIKDNQILPLFYEITKGTKFPESKFQDAYDRMKVEADLLGYTRMNKYLALNGLNYILEHDSMALDLVSTKEINTVISSKIIELSVPQSMKNFNELVKKELDRVSLYQAENDGKSPRGKQKMLELVY